RFGRIHLAGPPRLSASAPKSGRAWWGWTQASADGSSPSLKANCCRAYADRTPARSPADEGGRPVLAAGAGPPSPAERRPRARPLVRGRVLRDERASVLGRSRGGEAGRSHAAAAHRCVLQRTRSRAL